MTEYAKLEDELNAAENAGKRWEFRGVVTGVIAAASGIISADSFEESSYRMGAFLAVTALINVVFSAGSFLNSYNSYAEANKIQREIDAMKKQKGLEKKVEV